MDIRETLNKYPAAVVVGLVVALGLAGVLLWNSRSTVETDVARQMFYSDDDGKTWFADDTTKIYPFDHNGKRAFRVYVFQGNDNKPFVGYLVRYKDATHAALVALAGKTDVDSRAKFMQLAAGGQEVKKPGDIKWVIADSAEGREVETISSPVGGEVHGLTP